MYSFLEQFNTTANTSLHKSAGRSKKEVIQEFSKIVFKENSIINNIKKFCVILPGQFQPYHKGHLITYKLLRRMFGDESIFILPSIKMSLFNPLSFNQRKQLILKSKGMTLHPKNIIPRHSKGFDPIGLAKDLGLINKRHEYIFICVLSSGDTPLMPVIDKETYYQPWPAELYDATQSELTELSKLLPAMDKYGFRFTVDAFGPEIFFDFKKEVIQNNFLKKQFLIELGFNEVKRYSDQNKLDELQKYLPYDVELLKEMQDEILDIEEIDIDSNEDEIDAKIDLKKDLIQQLNNTNEPDELEFNKDEEKKEFI